MKRVMSHFTPEDVNFVESHIFKSNVELRYNTNKAEKEGYICEISIFANGTFRLELYRASRREK